MSVSRETVEEGVAWLWVEVAQYVAVKAAKESGWPWERWVYEMECDDAE